ncbi:DSBA oxidoreductase [groundwater metagenome]
MSKKKRAPPPKKPYRTMIYAGFALLVIIAVFAYLSLNHPSEVPIDIYSPDNSIPAKSPGAYSSLDVNPSEQGKVRIVEFLKFDCSPCYDLHKEMPGILKNYGDRVEIIYVPIAFEGQSTRSIEAYIIAKQMGKGKEMRDALFQAKFENNRDVMESLVVLKEVAAGIGLGPDFNAKLEGNYAKKSALKNNAYAQMYMIKGTPTILINGKEVNIPDLNSSIFSLLS